MNIMFLFYDPINPTDGGVTRVTHSLTIELQKRGHTVVFLSTEKEKRKYDYIAPQYRIDFSNDATEIKQEVKRLIDKYCITHVICQTLDEAKLFSYFPTDIKKIAVCHVQPFTYMGISRKRIWSTNTKNIRQLLFKAASLVLPKIYEKFFFKFEKQAIEDANGYADKVCFISERFFPRIKKYLPTLSQDKFVAISNPNTYDASSIKLPTNKENIILWVGRVENGQKNAIDFVRMWKHLSKCAIDWLAIVVGDGSDLEYIKNYAKKNKIERIEFTGRRNDTETFYKRAKYIAVTSYGESWGLVLTEAMSYGCVPVVYDTYETLHDIVDDKQNGYIIPSISYKSMADCLYNNMQKKDEFNEFSIAANKKMHKFSLESTVDKWEKLLKSM